MSACIYWPFIQSVTVPLILSKLRIPATPSIPLMITHRASAGRVGGGARFPSSVLYACAHDQIHVNKG